MRDALGFLTTLPVPPREGPPRPGSVRWFPLVGLVVGLAWAVAYAAVNLRLGPFVAAAVTLVVDAVVTGGLHLDATADVADGTASRKPADEAVRIMREPGIGALGAAALVLVCLVRVSVLTQFSFRAVSLIAVPVAGRAAMALILALVPARPDGSLASAFQAGRAATVQAIGLAAVLVLIQALAPDNPLPFAGLAVLAVALVTAAGYALWWRVRFGLLTGDGAGAGGMMAETIGLFALGVLLDSV
jgi:adenosylcobinamide-GDP ribazoletransferase